MGEYRELGYLPQAIVNYLALLSWSHGDDEVLGIERLIAELRARGAVGQPGDLRHRQARLAEPPVDHGARPDAEHERLVGERLRGRHAGAGRAPRSPPPSSRRSSATPRCRSWSRRCSTRPALDGDTRGALAAAGERLDLFARSAPRRARSRTSAPDAARDLLADYRRQGKERLGYGPRELLMPLRLALTGREHGPELHFVLAALDAGETSRASRRAGATVAHPATPAPAALARPPARRHRHAAPRHTEGDRR